MQRFILRVLTGPNAGAEALLGERTTIGSAEADDITIGDGALAPGHFTVEVKGGAINLLVGEAPLTVKDDSRSNGTFPVRPFDLIKFGSTCCAIGPEGATWPAYAPADLLPPVPPAPAPPPEAAAADAPASEPAEPEPAPALAAPPLKRRVTHLPHLPSWTRWAAGAAVAVLLLIGVVVWIEGDDADDTVQAGRQTAQDIVTAQGLKGVTIKADGRHGLVAEGFVLTTDQQRRLRQALQDAGVGVKNKVVSLEQQVSAARTIASATGARLTVEGDPENGKIVVDGFVPDIAQKDAIVRGLQRDIVDLRPLEMRIVTPDTVRAEVVEQLRSSGLDGQTTVDVAGNVIRIRGSLAEDGRRTVTRLADELNGRWQGMARVENATTGVMAPVPLGNTNTSVTVKASPTPAKFVIIVGGKDGFVRDEAGRRYGIGDTLANGEVIEEIRVEEIITSRDGVKYRYTFGGGR